MLGTKTVQAKGIKLQGGRVVSLNGVVREGLSKIGIFEQRPDGMRRVMQYLAEEHSRWRE